MKIVKTCERWADIKSMGTYNVFMKKLKVGRGGCFFLILARKEKGMLKKILLCKLYKNAPLILYGIIAG